MKQLVPPLKAGSVLFWIEFRPGTRISFVTASAKEGAERAMRGYFDCALIDRYDTI